MPVPASTVHNKTGLTYRGVPFGDITIMLFGTELYLQENVAGGRERRMASPVTETDSAGTVDDDDG